VISFVCSVGNIPLAAVLWNGGISFGDAIAFIFADLIILPILKYLSQVLRMEDGRSTFRGWLLVERAIRTCNRSLTKKRALSLQVRDPHDRELRSHRRTPALLCPCCRLEQSSSWP